MFTDKDELMKIDKVQFKLLKDKMIKLKDFYEFTLKKFNYELVEIIKGLVAVDPKQSMISDALLWEVIRTLDKIVILNEVKTRKESPSNELTYYKRVLKYADEKDPEELPDQLINHLQSFFGNPHSVVNEFRKTLQAVHGSYLIVVQIANECVNYYNKEYYTTTQEKYMLIRVMQLCLYLIDGAHKISDKDRNYIWSGHPERVNEKQINNEKPFDVFKKGGLNLDGIRTILISIPRIPILFEISFQTLKFVKMCSKFKEVEKDWPDQTNLLEKDYDITKRAPDFEREVEFAIAEYSNAVRQYCSIYQEQGDFNSKPQAPPPATENSTGITVATVPPVISNTGKLKENSVLQTHCLYMLRVYKRTLKLLSRLNEFLQEFLVWKFLFFANEAKIKQVIREEKRLCESQGVPFNEPDMSRMNVYEKAARYNLTGSERSSLCLLITLIRQLSGIILKSTNTVQPFIDRAVFVDVQRLCQITMRKLLYKATKNKKNTFKDKLIRIREVAASWSNKRSPSTDPALSGKEDKNYTPDSIRTKSAQPQQTQLFILKSLISSIASPRSPSAGKGLFGSADIDQEDQQLLQEWMNGSFFYPATQCIHDTVVSQADLSMLWYREDFLERDKKTNKIVQYKIDSSLPWILTQHAMRKRTFELDNILCYFDLYSDAANTALRKLKCRFLFEEIEGEAQLGMEQLLFHLPRQIFNYMKKSVGLAQLDSTYRTIVDWTPMSKKKKSAPVVQVDGQNVTRQQTVMKKGSIGVSLLTPFSVPFENLFSLRNISLAGHNVDFGKALANRIEALLFQHVQIAVLMMTYRELLQFADMYMNVLSIIHERLSEVAPMKTTWQDMLDMAADRTNLNKFSCTLVNQFTDMAEIKICEEMSFNFMTMMFSPRKGVLPYAKALSDFNSKLNKFNIGQKLFSADLSRAFQHIFSTWSQSFTINPHMTSMLRWLEVEEIYTLVVNMCNIMCNCAVNAVNYAQILSLILPFTGRAFPVFDPSGEEYKKYHEPRREALKTKVGTLKAFVKETTKIGNILAFIIQLDCALAAQDMKLFNQGSAASLYSLRTGFPNQLEKLPRHTSSAAPTPRGQVQIMEYMKTWPKYSILKASQDGSSGSGVSNDKNVVIDGMPVNQINPLELAATAMDFGGAIREEEQGDSSSSSASSSMPDVIPNMAPGALNAVFIHERPLFTYAVQRLYRTLNQDNPTNENGEPKAKNFFVISHGRDTFTKPENTSFKSASSQFNYTAQPFDKETTLDDESIPHAKMLYEVCNDVIDMALSNLPKSNKFEKSPVYFPEPDRQASNESSGSTPNENALNLNLWDEYGDGLWMGILSMVHVVGQYSPFKTTSPLSIVDTLLLMSDGQGATFSPMKGEMALYRSWADRLKQIFKLCNSLLNSSMPLHPMTKVPIGPKDSHEIDLNFSPQLKAELFKRYVPGCGNGYGTTQKIVPSQITALADFLSEQSAYSSRYDGSDQERAKERELRRQRRGDRGYADTKVDSSSGEGASSSSSIPPAPGFESNENVPPPPPMDGEYVPEAPPMDGEYVPEPPPMDDNYMTEAPPMDDDYPPPPSDDYNDYNQYQYQDQSGAPPPPPDDSNNQYYDGNDGVPPPPPM